MLLLILDCVVKDNAFFFWPRCLTISSFLFTKTLALECWITHNTAPQKCCLKFWFIGHSCFIFFSRQNRFCYIFLVGVGSALWSVNPPHPIHYWSTAGAQRGGQPAQHSYLHLEFAREVYIVTTTLKLYTVGNPHTPYSKSQMTRQICHLVHRSV